MPTHRERLNRPPCLALAIATTVLLAPPAFAGFINGVERFDGTVLDSATWEPFIGSNEEIDQDSALTILDPLGGISGNAGDYTTRQLALLPDSSVAVTVTPAASGIAALFLTNNSQGPTQTTPQDSYWVQVSLNVEPDERTGSLLHFPGGNGGGGPVETLTALDDPLGRAFTLQIDRPDDTAYAFRAYDAQGTLLGASTLTDAPAHPEPLFISLAGFNGMTATWDNVTVTGNLAGNIVPEPTTLALIAAARWLLRPPRRRPTVSP